MKTAAIQIASHNASHNRPSRSLWSLLFLALFLSLQIVASSGALHQAVHSDASSPSHHCIITLLTQGQLNEPFVMGVWLAFAATLIFFLPSLQAAVQSSLDLRLAPGRAPPPF